MTTKLTTLEPCYQRQESGRKEPLAKWIALDLIRQIESGQIEVGDQLPWRDELCRHYGVSLITVRAALADLTARGLLESRLRGGIYVKRRNGLDSTKLTKSIALVGEVASNAFIAPILAGAAERAREAGFQVVLAPAGDDPDVEARLIEEFADQVDAMLVVPVNHTDSHVCAFSQLIEQNHRLIFIDHYLEEVDAPSVTSDNIHGGYLATRQLIEAGCKHVYAASSGGRTTSSRERLRGYIQALDEFGRLLDPNHILHTSLEDFHSAGISFTRRIIQYEQGKGRPGIFATNDIIAAGCYTAVREAGLRIPDDVAIVGFDDVFGAYMDPPLTTVRQDLTAMGRTAVDMYLRLAAGDPVKPTRLPVELIVRGSV